MSTCSKPIRVNLARSLGFNRMSTRIRCWYKHGHTTLAIPGHDPPMEITVFMDISINPGPILHKIPVRTTVNRGFAVGVGVASAATVFKLISKYE